MISEPSFSFTIPSVHDNTTLDCRIYHPPTSCRSGLGKAIPWRPRGAIIAHPYAPLGGCYDDYVVLSTVAGALQEGYVVGTFNFRGAGSSKGRTSWSATPETLDYISFIGFFVYYVSSLHATSSPDASREDSGTTLSTIPSAKTAPCSPTDTLCQPHMILIIGGYSYGSLVTTLLPATESILIRFTNVTIGSAEAEIRLRALHLSVQWNRHALTQDRSLRDKIGGAQEKAQEKAVVMGGEESERGTRRPSKDSRRSIDNIRRSVDFSRRKLGLRQTKSGEAEALSLEPGVLPIKLPMVNSYYLLISPLRPPISALMTLFSNVRHHGFGNDPFPTNLHRLNPPDAATNLVTNATLAVYGDKDFFTSQRKLRKWVEDLAGRPRSTFQFREIVGAGHFWQEEGVEAQLKTSIRDWLRDIMSR